MQKVYPPVIVVDENDHEIGTAMVAEVWQKGLYHRIASVFVLDDAGRMLLQLRSTDAKMHPECWDQAAGGHVDAGQTYDQTAENELAEELGLTDVKLEPLGTFRTNETLDDGRIINQFERVYLATVPQNTKLNPDAEEVKTVQWFNRSELKTLIAEHPEKFTSGLRQALRNFMPDFIR